MTGPANPPIGKKSPPMPTEKDLIAFDHVAAGHEGMSSNASGTLVIKPCKEAERDFYESAKKHPLFQVHIPTYMGSLTLSNDQSAADSLAPLLAQAAQSVAGHGSNRMSTSSLPQFNELLSPPSIIATTSNNASPAVTSIAAKRASWKPSGGKKLDTDLAIVLENVAADFQHPNILDVKLGARLWDDDAPMSKRRKLDDVSNETTSGSLGFRIAGMKIWNKNSSPPPAPSDANIELKDGYRVFNKHYGRTFTAANVKYGFAEYLGGLTTSEKSKQHLKNIRSKLIAQRMIHELQSIQAVLEAEESRMYSASILMIYEGDEQALEDALRDEEMRETAEAENKARNGRGEEVVNGVEDEDDLDNENEDDDEDEDEEEIPKVCDVRLIDFAHASWTPGLGPDENMLQGLRSVINVLAELVNA